MAHIYVPPLRWYHRLADRLMEPIMHHGTYSPDRPQRTHFWNNKKYPEGFALLDRSKGVSCKGDSRARKDFRFPGQFHMPKYGGWTKYVVLRPEVHTTWHVVWQTPQVTGVSMIPINGLVRCLRGPDNAWFFGVNTSGEQIPIRWFSGGEIGKGGPYHRELLL